MKKKILIVFLICCMLFGVASPAFALSGVLPPPDNPDYDSYIIVRYFKSSESNYYLRCFAYDSSVWNFYIDESAYTEDGLIHLRWYSIPFSDASVSVSPLYVSNPILYSNYDSSSSNNGWGSWRISENRYGKDVSLANWDSSNYYLRGNYSFAYISDFISHDCDFISTNDIYIGSLVESVTGSLVFQGLSVFPPAPPDPMVTLAEQMMEMTPEALDLDGKLKILVPFGISCLALLISLPLLLKVLRRFLG